MTISAIATALVGLLVLGAGVYLWRKVSEVGTPRGNGERSEDFVIYMGAGVFMTGGIALIIVAITLF